MIYTGIYVNQLFSFYNIAPGFTALLYGAKTLYERLINTMLVK